MQAISRFVYGLSLFDMMAENGNYDDDDDDVRDDDWHWWRD